MKLRTARILKNLLCFGAVIPALISWFFKDSLGDVSWILWIVAAALLIAGFVVTLLFYRCPYCRHVFSGNSRLPEECPICHQKLER